MRAARGSVRLAESTDEVWAFISHPENFSQYVDGYDHGRVTSAAPVGVGARYEWTAVVGPVKLRSTEEIVEWEAGRRVAYEGELAGVPFRSSMAVRPSPEGGTMLDVEIVCRVPLRRGGWLAERALLGPLIQRGVRRSLEKLGRRFGSLGGPG